MGTMKEIFVLVMKDKEVNHINIKGSFLSSISCFSWILREFLPLFPPITFSLTNSTKLL